MELERPHRPAAPSTAICFSSMRLSSKSMVSPGRADKPPISLSASLSRRLRSKNGSLKGGQSPMFPPGMCSSRKRGGSGAIDSSSSNNNHEPSSPKVTCIGQVRVKTKKHGKKMKMNMSRAYRARRSGSSGDLRGEGDGCLQHNQRWVHLPVAICGALRGFGSDFNCFSPCKPSCFSGSKEGRGRGSKSSYSCSCCGGSVCRWLVGSHEGEGKRRDIELVVGGEEEDRGVERVMETLERECSRRRSIFDDVDFNIDEICQAGNEIEGEGDEDEEEAAARVSLCVPPKNALLLMRCRSDPVKMSALSSRFWESPPKNQPRGDEEDQDRPVEETRRRSSVSERVKVESLSSFAEEETGRRRSSASERVKAESISMFTEEETGRRRSSVSERVKVESLSNYAEETGRRRSSVSERVKVESLPRNEEEETGRRRSSVSERVKVEPVSRNAEEETGRRRSSVSERVKAESLSRNAEEETGRRRSSFKVESLSSYADEEAGRRRNSFSERVKAESLSSYAEEEAGRRRSSVSERGRVESLSNYAEEETGRRRSSFSERVKVESLSSYAEETGRRRSSFNERVKVEPLSSYSEETGRRRSSANERVKVESLSSYAEETGRRRSSVSERVKIESLSSFAEEEKGKSPENTEPQPEVESEIDGGLIQEEKLQEENNVEIQQTVGDKVSSFEQSEEEIQPQPLKEDERPEQQPLEEASEDDDDDSMEEEEGKEREEEESGLPDCLLLMMCEPKVSMEVSKETWVCSTDFIRWLPERHRQHHLKKINPTNGDAAATTTTKKKKKPRTTPNTDPNPPPPARPPSQPQGFQPPRSSCSFPIGAGVSTVKEKKLVAYEPFVLTRCKSEPMRSATAKLAPAPELSCFWKNRKIEPHRPAVGAAGLGC